MKWLHAKTSREGGTENYDEITNKKIIPASVKNNPAYLVLYHLESSKASTRASECCQKQILFGSTFLVFVAISEKAGSDAKVRLNNSALSKAVCSAGACIKKERA